jgi:hypothetical protein
MIFEVKMKTILILLGPILVSHSILNAQENPFIEFRSQKPDNEKFRYSYLNNNFYDHNNGSTQLMMSNDYVGSSFSFFKKTTNRFQYGLNSGIIPILNDYPENQPNYSNQSRLLLIPFWLSLKIRLRTNLDNKLIPYFIGGLGPTLGLDLRSNMGFIDTISYLRSELGGGAFIGAGVDYIWTDDWAISLDVRYNIFAFDHPLGEDKEFSGFSVYIGFIRAFGL